MKSYLSLLSFLAVLLNTSVVQAVPSFPKWTKADLPWLEKTAQKLRLGRGLGRADPIDRWKTLTPETVVEEIIAAPDFSDTLADFLMYFYGLKPASLRAPPNPTEPDTFDVGIFEYPQSIAAVKNYYSDGKFFERATQFHAPLYVRPIATKLTQAERAKIYDRAQVFVDEQIAKLDSLQGDEPKLLQACYDFMYAEGERYFQFLYDLGWDTFVNEWFFEPNLTGKLYEKCLVTKSTKDLDLKIEYARLKGVLSYLRSQEPALLLPSPRPNNVKDIYALDLSTIGFDKEPLSLRVRFDLRTATNSSTNFNRKRSAWVLKRFFCDDLNPLNVQIPANHPNAGEHATSPSCYACHYKLDPMAGFFRTYGIYFGDYGQNDHIVFDDKARTDLQSYVAHWRLPQGVGYIRSTTDPSVNTYGSSLADLEKILNEAPEVKRCFVRRAFEYFVGADQAVNSGYLDDLTSSFTKTTQVASSAQAFRNLVKTLVQSGSFRAVNRDTSQCYDYGMNSPPSSLPCKMSTILQNHCVECHSTQEASGGLVLDRRELQSDGILAFPHRRRDGTVIGQKQTLQMIMDRITDADPNRRMPQDREMPSIETQALYLWATEESGK